MKQEQRGSFLSIFFEPETTGVNRICGRIDSDVRRRIKRYLLDPVWTQARSNLKLPTELRLMTDIKNRIKRWI